jgi:two-component system, cell cycle response regulator
VSSVKIVNQPTNVSSADVVASSAAPTPKLASRALQKTLTSMDFGEIEIAPPPTRRDRAVLVRMDSIEAGRLYALEGPELRLGRMADNQVVIDDGGISRDHARLYRDGEVFRLDDLGSSNGTYLNGVRITSCEVADGALIQIGPRARFRFSIIDHHQERILRQLYEASVRDPLTGVFNRAYFVDRLSAELAYSKRHGTEVSVLILDIDHFKSINDTYGHPAGDWALKSFSATMFASLRTEDLFARYGGEEFGVVLRGIPIQNAHQAAERLRRATADMALEFEGRKIPVTVSIGGASNACAGVTDLNSLIATADRRLYVAKKSGRNTVITSD